jgi:hypothetical protein
MWALFILVVSSSNAVTSTEIHGFTKSTCEQAKQDVVKMQRDTYTTISAKCLQVN